MIRRAPVALTAFVAVFAFGALAATASAKSGDVVTDAWIATSPGKPWMPGPALESAGVRSWTATGPGETQAMLRVGYVAVLPGNPATALAELVRLEKAGIRLELDDRTQVEQSGFEADSMLAGGPGQLDWRGFRVNVVTPRRGGSSWRWVALHPRFPAVRRAFTLAYDESYPREGTPPNRLAAARALAATVAPAGNGLAGPLSEAWLDARADAFAARIDSAQRLCWTSRPDAAPGREHVGYGRKLAGAGDFYLLTGTVPRDSLVDPAPAEYGVVFDRNGDGKLDLLVVNRGLHPFYGTEFEAIVAVYGDDDFDGKVDALVVEDADKDADQKVESRLLVKDADENGRIESAVSFTASAGKGVKVAVDDQGRAKIRRLGIASVTSDFAETLRSATIRLSELDRARTACP